MNLRSLVPETSASTNSAIRADLLFCPKGSQRNMQIKNLLFLLRKNEYY